VNDWFKVKKLRKLTTGEWTCTLCENGFIRPFLAASISAV